MPKIIKFNKQKLLRVSLLVLSYMAIVLPLVNIPSALIIHYFSIITVGFLVYALIKDFNNKFYYNFAFIVLAVLLVSYNTDIITLYHLLIIFLHAIITVSLLFFLKNRKGVLLNAEVTKLYFISSVFTASIITAFIYKLILNVECNYFFA